MDNHLRKEMEGLNIPRMSIVFINDGHIVHQKTFGFMIHPVSFLANRLRTKTNTSFTSKNRGQ